MSRPKRAILTVLFAHLCAGEAASEGAPILEISGPAVVTDGDTIRIGNQIIRIYGIDAFENAQNCERHGRRYNCGAESENVLRGMLNNGASCAGSEFDSYNRLIARCLADSTDVGARMVRSGNALAYRKYASDYIGDEDDARLAKRGVWQGSFEAPWTFRAARWNAAATDTPNEGCPIKGNINRKGERIYHAPWSRSYARTRINVGKGERWFCSEAEALAAGWRAPFR